LAVVRFEICCRRTDISDRIVCLRHCSLEYSSYSQCRPRLPLTAMLCLDYEWKDMKIGGFTASEYPCPIGSFYEDSRRPSKGLNSLKYYYAFVWQRSLSRLCHRITSLRGPAESPNSESSMIYRLCGLTENKSGNYFQHFLTLDASPLTNLED
jgi:hypothetical protein